jgi:5-methylthioribose kinase
MTDADVRAYVQERLPDLQPVEVERLPEGNLNHVWRVRGAERSVVVKHAPPHIAADPDVPLDPSRVLVEAQCLTALGTGGRLSDVAGSAVQVPRPLDVNEAAHVLIMEDVGPRPTLNRWLQDGDVATPRERAPDLGRRLGRFLGRLHAATHDDPTVAEAFVNRPMQETRHAVQYQGVTDMLRRGGVDDAETLGARAERLGEALLEPGCCLTMGDLWPRSVLVGTETLYLIDWELAHYGRPLQDVAHFLAHLWMQAHRASSDSVSVAVQRLRDAFVTGYIEAVGEAREALWTPQEQRDAAIHFGAEILVRAVGPFQEGDLYEGLAPDHEAVQAAVETAAEHLRSPDEQSLIGG